MDFELVEQTAVLRFDDGKANAIGHDFMDGMAEGLARAQAEANATVIVGREGILSGGFDLKEVAKGRNEARAIMTKGARMFFELYSHPQPLAIACTGHAIAAGAFLLLACDNRYGSSGDFKIGLNETAINATFPVFAYELAQGRLAPAYKTRSYVQAELFAPEEACAAGFLDHVGAADSVFDSALETASRLAQLPGDTYAANKKHIRRDALIAMEAALV